MGNFGTAGILGSLVLSVIQLFQEGRTQEEIERLVGQRVCPTAPGFGPTEGELSEAEQEAADLRADLFLIEETGREHPGGKKLHVHVVGLDDCD